MNNKQILELTHHLSQALDQNYDVVNMETVLAVISNLEGTTITKEQLETTRLAKYINQLRRRTNNENLARRSKSLLKKWREMVGMQQSAGDTQQQPATSPVNSANVTFHSADNAPPNRQISQPTSPLAPNSAEQTIETRSAINCASNVSPTSFSNLINNLSSSNNNNVQQRVMAGADYSSNASLKTKTLLHTPYVQQQTQQQQQQQRTETFVIDHSSNSNSISNFGSTFVSRAKIDEIPIVIDIDSDSQESENTRLHQQQQQQQNVARTNITAMPLIQPVSVSTKVKKAKKEKKRREKETQCKVAGGFSKISAVSMHDERSTSNTTTQPPHKHKNDRSLTMSTTEGDLLVSAKEKKQQNSALTNISSMSEILSLSNSSMSSIFASDSGLTSLKNKSTTGVDLTFAGKFKTSHQQNLNNNSANNSSTTATATINGGDALEHNYVSGDSSNAAKDPKPTKSFIALTNDDNSTSSSHVFPFDVIDVVSQDNNQTKIIEELRSQSNAALQQSGGIGSELFDNNRNDGSVLNRDSAGTITAKMPKKRGRKKGSKGVDSIIAQETSLSQQIFGSGGKKVKTTKELFNEIQNRKLGLAVVTSNSSGVTQKPTLLHTTAVARQTNQKLHGIQSSRPASSCSEPSLHSPRTMDAYLTNATVSTGGATRSSAENISNPVEDGQDSESDTMTSEPSRDGIKQSKLNRTISVDSNSSSQLEPSSTILNSTKRTNKPISSNVATKTVISGAEAQLREIVQRLPLPDPTQLVEEEFTAQLVPCTCVLIEEFPKEETVDEATLESGERGDTKPMAGNEGGGVSSDMITTAGTNVQNQKVHDEQRTNVSKSSLQDTATIVKPIVQKPKKSIFDLDFDEDNDPLQSLIAEAAVAVGTSMKTDTAQVLGNIKSEQLNEIFEEGLPTTMIQEQNGADNAEQMLVAPLLLYRVVEDVNCMAKRRYDLQTNQITNFHIDALHNCYIPNVNGNWDDATLPTTTLMRYYDVTDGGDVVPQYGCLINERIPKDLSQLSSCKELKTIRAKFQNMPFLGVAKCLPSCRKQKRTLRRIATKQPKSEISLPNNGQHTDLAIKVEHVGEEICKKESTERLEINVGVPSAYELTNQQHEVIRSDDGSDFIGHGLLAIANSREPPTQLKPNFSLDADVDNDLDKAEYEEKEELNSRRSSSCSNSSLQKTQNSINEKLRKHQQSIKNMNYPADDSNVAKRKRKKRKKFSSRRENGGDSSERSEVVKQRKIKRIRIAINGDIATQRQISLVSSSNNNTSTDDDNEGDKDHVDCHNIMSSDTDKEDDKINYRNYVADGDDNNDSDSYKAEIEGGGSDLEVESVQSMATVESIMPDDEVALDVDIYNDYDMMPICSNVADEYAIVQRPMPESGSNTNHIVLTIKKTPSKTNSPANSLSAISPVIPTLNGVSNVTDDDVAKSSLVTHSEVVVEHKPSTPTVNGYAISDNKMTEIVSPECRLKPTDIQQRQRRRRRKSRVPRLDIQLNNLFPVVKPIMESSYHQLSTRKKKHRKLFFADELLVRNGEGRKECILNCSSCSSSSCGEESDYEYYTTSSVDEKTLDQNIHKEKENKEGLTTNAVIRVSTTSSTSSDSESSSEDKTTYKGNNNDVKASMMTEATSWYNEPLSSENNGLLPSFNGLSTDCPSRTALVVKEEGVDGGGEVDMLQQSNSLPNKNCDDYNNLYNNNNNTLNVIKYNLVNNTNFKKKKKNNNCSDDGAAAEVSSEVSQLTSSALVVDDINHNGTVVHNEYRTGIRTVSNNDISTNEPMNDVNDDNSLTRSHQFKEWHQVLQLRSYNNELLTVLPYVLLE